jgi:hypothetical protein
MRDQTRGSQKIGRGVATSSMRRWPGSKSLGEIGVLGAPTCSAGVQIGPRKKDKRKRNREGD